MNILNTNQWLQVIFLPIVFTIIGMLAKRLGKRDGDDSPRVNDWAVSTSIVLMTFGKIAADLAEQQGDSKHGNPVWWLLGVLLTLFISIEHDRFRSWKADKNSGMLTKEKRIFIGIIIPNLVSVTVFVSYQLYKFMAV